MTKLARNNLIVGIVFFIFAWMTFPIRDTNGLRIPVMAFSTITHDPIGGGLCNDFPICGRIGYSIVETSLFNTFRAIGGLFNISADVTYPIVDTAAKTRFMILSADFVFKLLILIPLYLVAIYFFRTLRVQLLFLLVLFGSFYGWGQVGNPLVGCYLMPYDYFATGFFFFLFWYFNSERMTLKKTLLFLMMGQIFYEYLGGLTGLSTALFLAWILPARANLKDRTKVFLVNLLPAFVVSVSVSAIIYQLLLWNNNGVVNAQGGVGLSLYFKYGFSFFHVENFKAFKSAMWTLIKFPLLAGIIFGCIWYYWEGRREFDWNIHLKRTRALTCISLAFLATLIPGAIFSGLLSTSEMGRQLLPFLVMLGYTSAAWTLFGLRRVAPIQKT